MIVYAKAALAETIMYLAGMIAGELTQTGVIGVVGGYPVPEVNRITNAFLAGAREVNRTRMQPPGGPG